MKTRYWIILGMAVALIGAADSTYRYIERLAIGGGASDSDGGSEFDATGNGTMTGRLDVGTLAASVVDVTGASKLESLVVGNITPTPSPGEAHFGGKIQQNIVVGSGTPTPTVFVQILSSGTPIFQVRGTGINFPLTNSGKITASQNLELEAGGGGSIIAKLGDKIGAQKLKIRDTDNVDVSSIDSDGNGRYIGRIMVGTPTGTPTPGTIVVQRSGTIGGVVIGEVPTWIPQP